MPKHKDHQPAAHAPHTVFTFSERNGVGNPSCIRQLLAQSKSQAVSAHFPGQKEADVPQT
jgi:hypothetical protein